jgi:outer membrane protein assembly factor BamA
MNLNCRSLFSRHLIISFGGIFLLLLLGHCSYSQGKTPLPDSLELSGDVDLFDIIRKWTGKPPKAPEFVAVEGVRNLSLLPVIGYTPANGFVLGAAISVTKYRGNPRTTDLSSALINASITTKNQLLLNFKFDLYLPDNKWHISGDNRLLFFNQPTYGLGIYGLQGQSYFSVNGDNTGRDTSQAMKFNYLRLYETFLRKIAKGWYAGLGIMIDDNFKIDDQTLKVDSPAHTTSHYKYSKTYDFDTAHYSANGLSFQIMHDSRDNPIEPFSGNYFNIAYRVSPKFFGSSQSSTMLYYEYRTYFSMSKTVPRNVLAFWFWGVSVLSGRMPYLELPAITWDTYNRSGRGYIQGRFRGDNMMYGESEYRFRITKNNLFGGVVFLNCTTASNPLTGQSMFSSLAPGYGFGLRILMNKNDRTNICVDYGRGYGFSGIYFNIREVF